MIDGEVLPQLAESPLQPWSGIPEWQRGVLPPERDRIDT
jgi:hypothetical protein